MYGLAVIMNGVVANMFILMDIGPGLLSTGITGLKAIGEIQGVAGHGYPAIGIKNPLRPLKGELIMEERKRRYNTTPF